MVELNREVQISENFAKMAAAFKRQFRLDLIIDSTGEDGVIYLTDGQGQGDVKYLGTLRSNWLRRNAKRFGFRSIGHELLPEVAGGAYVYEFSDENVETAQESETDENVETAQESETDEQGVLEEDIQELDESLKTSEEPDVHMEDDLEVSEEDMSESDRRGRFFSN